VSGITSASLLLHRFGRELGGWSSGTDTGMKADTGKTASDTGKNQSQSGVTNKTGKWTLGPKVTKTRPDQNQPVTSKGDSVSNSGDTSASAPK